MGSLSDKMLSRGCVSNIEAIHGEDVMILDTGLTFKAVREIVPDLILDVQDVQDHRAKIILHFVKNPGIGRVGLVRTSDGKRWQANIRDEAGYLTNDYDLSEITSQDS